MKNFTDAANRTWTVNINVATIRRVRDTLDYVSETGTRPVLLTEVLDNKAELMRQLERDPVLLIDTIFVLCRDQCEKAGVTDEQFGQAMVGDVIENARNAFLEALTDFFPQPETRAILSSLIAKSRGIQKAAFVNISKAVDAIDPVSVAKTLTAFATNSRAA